jgi:hypothetical protein
MEGGGLYKIELVRRICEIRAEIVIATTPKTTIPH